MTVTLGIDVGTFESKGVAVEDGRILAESRRPHGLDVKHPGWAEHDAEEVWWGDAAAIARDLTAQLGARKPEALAVSAIGPCCLPVDARGTPLRAGILYGVDARATEEIALLNAQIGESRILEECGVALNSQAVGPKILWLRREPHVWAATARLHTATSFIVERLTGAHVMDRYTAASWAPLFDIRAAEWGGTHGICEPAQLPRLLWSAEIAGAVTPEAAALTGLPENLPVTTGTIDAAAEAVSVGTSRPGDMMLMYGSTVFIILLSETRVTDPRLWAAPWLFPGLHAAMAGLATSGTLTQWFRELTAPHLPRDDAFATLAAEALASPPGARGLVALPYFSGERTPLHDPGARGAILGLDLTHTRGDLYRALLEGIAAATRHVVETFRDAGAPPLRALAVGGGTRTEAWLQATSDMTGLPQTLARTTTGAAYGDAFLAAQALGLSPDMALWNPPARTVEPRAIPAYDAHWRTFRLLHDRTRDLLP